tara:strand:- start:414 stop:557 length:144 start_codon:yes stop_codon:yes gene_type:complete
LEVVVLVTLIVFLLLQEQMVQIQLFQQLHQQVVEVEAEVVVYHLVDM